MGLKINVRKSKPLTFKKDQLGSCEKGWVNGEEMQEVGKFNYLGMKINTDAGMGEGLKWLIGFLREERYVK